MSDEIRPEDVPKLGAWWKMGFYVVSAQLTYFQGVLVTMGQDTFAAYTLEKWLGFAAGFLGATILAIKTYTSHSWPKPNEEIESKGTT